MPIVGTITDLSSTVTAFLGENLQARSFAGNSTKKTGIKSATEERDVQQGFAPRLLNPVTFSMGCASIAC
jgi:hypothetical protein